MQARLGYVAGQVQGVWFRQSTRSRALQLGVRGWVRNLDDGRVAVYAVGTEPQLEALRAWLAVGPPRARVSSVQWEPAAVDNGTGFEIR